MINRLVAQIKKTGAPIVVGLDPMMKFIPEHIKEKAFAEFGETLEGAVEAIWQYNKAIVDAIYELVPAVKPQIAMYEQFGLPGLSAFYKTVQYCKKKGLVVIGDIKRGDIGSTSAAYAVGHLGKVKVGNNSFAGFDEDFVTVNPYLGTDGVKPFVDVCKEEKKGIFVLVKTSNKSSGELQDQKIGDKTVYEVMGGMCESWGADSIGKYGYSAVGAVVGATYPQQLTELRIKLPHTFFLVPGYGAQGGGAQGLAGAFDEKGLGAVVNSSRAIMCAYQKEGCDERDFAGAARREALRMREDITSVLHR